MKQTTTTGEVLPTEQAIEKLERDAATLEEYGAAATANAIRACTTTFKNALARLGDEPLSLGDAALASCYSVDHLSRLVRSGAIPNAGRKGKPKIRRCHLPKKAIPISSAASYNRITDARRLGSRARRLA